MDYHIKYGLEFNPFIKNSKKDIIVETSEYKQTMIRLNHLTSIKGFGLITGNPGRGKTTIVRNWANGLNPSLYKVVYISLSTVTVMEFYRQLAIGIGIEPYYRKVDNFKAIQETVNQFSLEKRITPVIILDEANYIKPSILNDLKLIFNFDMDSRDRAVVLLVGLPYINNTLKTVAQEPLRQRVVTNYHVDSLDKEESKIYIKKKLEVAGAINEIFTPNALEAIVNTANGNCRIMNQLCNNCLFIGNDFNMENIDEEIVLKAVTEMEIG